MKEIRFKTSPAPPFRLEHADVVTDPLFLVLRYALGNPRDITDFLGNS